MLRPPIEFVRFTIDEAVPGVGVLAREFPTVRIERSDPRPRDAVIDGRAWRTSATFRPFDEAVEASFTPALAVVEGGDGLVCEILTRYQRFVLRRNAASTGPMFDHVLRVHRALFDLQKPLVKADYDHALDAWQWMLRLDPNASLAAQLAVLFHDVERLESEADARVEQHAPDYQSFKDAHARRGATLAYDILCTSGVDEVEASRVRAIIALHERRGVDRDVDLVNDADALSFFSLNSAGYLDYFGPEQTAKKIAYTNARLGAAARAKLALVRFRPDVEAIVRAEAAP